MNSPTFSQFIDAIRRADAGTVRNLLHNEPQWANEPIAANPAEQTANQQTPLHLAMPGDGNELRPEQLEIAQLLIDAGAKIDAVGHGPNHGPCSPLSLAAWGGHTPLVELLLANGADANGLPQTDAQHRPLQTASNHGHAEAAGLLIDAGAQHGLAELLLVGLREPLKTYLSTHKNPLTQPLADGSYPLHAAVCTAPGTQLLAFLLESGADPTQTDAQDRTPLLKAVECENAWAIDLLKKPNSTDDIFTAAALGNAATVENLLQRSPNWARSTHADGVTPLFYAAFGGHCTITEYLLDAGAEPAPRSERFWACLTPLHLSLYKRHAAITQLLLARGADPNAYSPAAYKPTPLHAAARWGTPDDIRLLLDSGADIYGGQTNREDTDNGLFRWMCFAGQTAVLELLLERGLDLEHPRCRLLLHAACDSGHIELSRRLLEAGMHRDAQDEQGRTPRERALAQGHHDLAALL
jgi:ankyrin repeat protein